MIATLRDKISLMKRHGMTHEAIAQDLKISIDTLREVYHYHREKSVSSKISTQDYGTPVVSFGEIVRALKGENYVCPKIMNHVEFNG